MGKDNMQAKRVTTREEEAAQWPRVSRFMCGSSRLCFIFWYSIVHGCHFAARGCTDVQESWIQLQER
ncbi:hypothetical protein E2C01_095392 [Portunus trituberculatus]|uniref:Uncharacterized protein n=1 Tax=Portunus trituberculatus TaxID=210409 RepID=A0A5B7JZA3_PORTR|nr:hypothetical protein [Portunus trituberculatus]